MSKSSSIYKNYCNFDVQINLLAEVLHASCPFYAYCSYAISFINYNLKSFSVQNTKHLKFMA